MSEVLEWFYYAEEKQFGPLSLQQLKEALSQGIVRSTDYVYRDGFADWKLVSDVSELTKSGRTGVVPPKPPTPQRANRAPIQELVVAHNNKNIVTGTLLNISTSGVFLETLSAVFKLNEDVKLTIKEGRGLGKPLQLKARVVRYANDPNKPRGYGLELRELNEEVVARIKQYIVSQAQLDAKRAS